MRVTGPVPGRLPRPGLLLAAVALAAVVAGVVGAARAGPGGIPGWIVFDSDRAGQFDIWKMRPDGSSPTRLTQDPSWELYPDWSPDGRRIVFALHRPKETREGQEIVVMDADGRNARTVARDGTFPQFTPDGTGVIFERGRRQVVRVDLATGREQRVFPAAGREFGNEVVKPRLSPDGKTVLFITDRGVGWNVWAAGPDGKAFFVADGCEGSWHPDGDRVFYIAGGEWTGTSIGAAAWPGGKGKTFLELDGEYRHVYFPSASDDGRNLLFSACPAGQHDHYASNYQVFILPLAGGRPVRLTHNRFDDRWPRLSTKAR